MIRIDVLGTPAPKGSGRAMLLGGKARFIASGSSANQKALQSWDVAVRVAANDVLAERRSDEDHHAAPLYVETPLAVVLVFRMRRPGGHYAKSGSLKPSAPRAPLTKPDADKLTRATLDSLHGIVFDDDSRIVELLVRKEYARGGNEGATILVDEWRPPLAKIGEGAIVRDAEGMLERLLL